MVLTVTEAQCQLTHQCNHILAHLGDPGFHTMAEAAVSLEAI